MVEGGADERTDERTGDVTRPVLGTPVDYEDRPPRRLNMVAYMVIGLIVLLMAGGWGYVLLAARGNPEVRAEVIAFDTSAADSAEITFSVYKPADREAICRLRAVDTQHVEVGSREIDIPTGKSDISLKERLKTSAQATAVHVQYCNLV